MVSPVPHAKGKKFTVAYLSTPMEPKHPGEREPGNFAILKIDQCNPEN